MKGKQSFSAINQISLQIQPMESVGIVGESGSGKSTLAKMIVMLEKPSTGKILFKNQNLFDHDRKRNLELRKQIQIVFQNPFDALNPCMTLCQILNEPLDIHHLHRGTNRLKRIHELIQMVGLDKHHLERYPHQFSGGQLQRICIARALAVEPSLLICDEPLSALDLSIQAQIINLLRKCQKDLGLTLFFISHDLAAVDMLADRAIVMQQGRIVEEGATDQLFKNPSHPYTKELIKSAIK